MLIKCPDCFLDVSDQAPACLRCGRPIAAKQAALAPPPGADARPAVIEATSKRWKGLQLFGWIAFIVGLPSCFRHEFDWQGGSLLIGMGCIVIGRFGAWWNHA